MTHVVSACASDADLAWGREMVHTFLPQATEGERVVQLVSMVKRQGSQIPYKDMSCVLAGGGKCGPRSSFGVFINQAFGIPSIGVGQPGHAAVCWRDPTGNWQLGYGRGWHVSKVTDRFKMSGPEFVASAKGRGEPLFAQVEHLRWLAAVLEKPSGCYLPPADRSYANPRAAAVMEVAKQLKQARGELDGAPFDEKPSDEISLLRSFKAPASDGEYYWACVRGCVHPPETGDYVFSITSDDDSDLFLSTDATATNKVFIAHVSGWSDPADWSRKSQPIRLEGGKKYYIEAVHRELDGGDHLAVAWSGPGVSEGVIGGGHLSHPSGEEGCIAREVWRRPPAEKDPSEGTNPPAAKPEEPIEVPPGVIHVEAEDFFTRGGTAVYGGGHPSVPVVNCHDGGKQLCFQLNMADTYVGYKIHVPKAGIYDLTARVAVINWHQCLFARTFGTMPRPVSARVSSVFHGNVKDLGAPMAVDESIATRWAVNEGVDQAWLELDMGKPIKFSTFLIDERTWNRVSKFRVEYKDGDGWKPVYEGTNIGVGFSKEFPPVMAQQIRLNILACRQNGGPTIWDFGVGTVADGHTFINPEWSPATADERAPGDGGSTRGLAGRWQTTAPKPIRLAEGEQTIWLSAGFQRGLALRWFELTPRAE